jgi:hypothetical protein
VVINVPDGTEMFAFFARVIPKSLYHPPGYGIMIKQAYPLLKIATDLRYLITFNILDYLQKGGPGRN